MSGVSLPVTRPSGRALIVGAVGSRSQPTHAMQRLGFTCAEADDVYVAMLELSRRPTAYRAVIVSLAGTYREELVVIPAVRRRCPQVEVWLAHTDNRPALLAEAMRLGADGLLSDDGLHRIAVAVSVTTSPSPRGAPAPVSHAVAHDENDDADSTDDVSSGEPVLTAEELRALLEEQPAPQVGD